MSAVHSVLVIGGGVAGSAAAIALAGAGVAVDLAEISGGVTALGSGITLQGNALRAFGRLGVYDECIAAGQPFDTLTLYDPDNGSVLHAMPAPATGGPDLPAVMGMYRPDLARILMARAEAVGVKVRFSCSVVGLASDDTGVDVDFADGSSARYDLVIGADGIRSATRDLLGVTVDTRPVGLGIWRVFAPRPPHLDGAGLYYGGTCQYSGFTPTSSSTLYAHLTEDACDRSHLTPEQRRVVFMELAGGYHGPWDEIRAGIDEDAEIHYTHAETHLLDGPWHRGRVVLIGDAVHTCPPTIAQGAAMGLEDALVLAELLTTRDGVDDALWQEFTDRRLDRVRTVIDASNRIAAWQVQREQGDVPGLMASIATVVAREP